MGNMVKHNGALEAATANTFEPQVSYTTVDPDLTDDNVPIEPITKEGVSALSLIGTRVKITGGIGQSTDPADIRVITAYDGTTATVHTNWAVTPTIVTANAQAGAAGSVTLAAGAANGLTGAEVIIYPGTINEQRRIIATYDNGTKVATVTPDWTLNPAAGTEYTVRSVYALLPHLKLSGDIIPASATAYQIGSATRPFNDMFSVNAVTVTSDGNKKNLDKSKALGRSFIKKLDATAGKWKESAYPVARNEAGQAVDDYGQPIPYFKKDETVHQWLVAQQVKEAADSEGMEFGGYVEQGDEKFLRYGEFIPPIINAFQDQDKDIEAMKKEIEDLEKEVADLKTESGSLKNEVSGLKTETKDLRELLSAIQAQIDVLAKPE
jgi:flagellin-like hook-associated protein FlgL